MAGFDPSAMLQQGGLGMATQYPMPGTVEFQQLSPEDQKTVFQMHMLIMQNYVMQQQQQLQQCTMTPPQSLPQAPGQGELESIEVEPGNDSVEANVKQASTETIGAKQHLTMLKEGNPESPENADAGNSPNKHSEHENTLQHLQSGKETRTTINNNKVTTANPQLEIGDGDAKEKDAATHMTHQSITPAQKQALPGHADTNGVLDDTGVGDFKESMPPISKASDKLPKQDHDTKGSMEHVKNQRKCTEEHTAEKQPEISSGSPNVTAPSQKSTKAKLTTEDQVSQTSYTGGSSSTEERSPDDKSSSTEGKPTVQNSSGRDKKEKSSDDKLTSAKGKPTVENSSGRDKKEKSSDPKQEAVKDEQTGGGNPGSSVDPLTAAAEQREALTQDTLSFAEAGEVMKSIKEKTNQDRGSARGPSSPPSDVAGGGHPDGQVFGTGRPHSDSYSRALKEGNKELQDKGSEASGVRRQTMEY